ncbi:MAG TPA: radical SAM family heme chaperone HemW [Gaiellaceae bacterium]|nr:radical SAM family heme chaperone HemW [Gaiellaceae bacterium]
MTHVRHLYVHLPFCAHRCGYCDFVTAVGRERQHGAYVGALLAELELERGQLAPQLETVFLGGGTPTFTEPTALERLLAALPAAREVTVEANPETVTPTLARSLRSHGVTRVSLGVQSFQPGLLAVLERRASPDAVRAAFHTLRDAGFDNISLDLLYGLPGQTAADLDADLAEALALAPEHLSCYELEAKPGTRFAHAWGDELARQQEALEGLFERVVDTLAGAGYRWYETANFCLAGERAGGRDLRAQHNLAYWRGADYLGLGMGAVSTVAGARWRNLPGLRAYLRALSAGSRPPRTVEPLDAETQARERLMLGLRLDEPLALDRRLEQAVDPDALRRLRALGFVELEGAATAALRATRKGASAARGADASALDHADAGASATVAPAQTALRLTRRGRFVGGGVTAELLA